MRVHNERWLLLIPHAGPPRERRFSCHRRRSSLICRTFAHSKKYPDQSRLLLKKRFTVSAVSLHSKRTADDFRHLDRVVVSNRSLTGRVQSGASCTKSQYSRFLGPGQFVNFRHSTFVSGSCPNDPRFVNRIQFGSLVMADLTIYKKCSDPILNKITCTQQNVHT